MTIYAYRPDETESWVLDVAHRDVVLNNRVVEVDNGSWVFCDAAEEFTDPSGLEFAELLFGR